MKARPVNPMCKHRMRELFGAVGRAWMFIVNQWQADHFILKRAEPTQCIVDTKNKFRNTDPTPEFTHHIWDIDSCYPSMPRGSI